MLLDYARDTLAERDTGAPEVHRQLLSVLARSADLESLLSLESCARFLARWDELRPQLGNRAPLHALPALGLLLDEQLFAADDLGKRLMLNLVTLQQVRVMSASTLRQLAKRPYRDISRRERVVNATDALVTYQGAP